MDGKVCVITGANSGIGRAMAHQIAALGAHVVIVCRNEERGQETLEEIKRISGPDKSELIVADLSLREDVRRAATEVRLRHPKVHVLVNNVGVYLPRRVVTAEGFEAMFATNHLGVFLITFELLDTLLAAAPARVITVSSGGHVAGHIDFDDLQAERSFRGLRQYCNTKLANILFTRELSRRFRSRGLSANAFHPGGVRSGFAQDMPGMFGRLVRIGGPFLRSAEKAARTGTWLASAPEGEQIGGAYFYDQKERKPSAEARRDDIAERLWDVTARLAGVPS
jgi:retinol dehydrogenase 12